MSSCPGEGILCLLATDDLGDATYSDIERHVEGCQECKSVLDRLARRNHDPDTVSSDKESFPRIPGFQIHSVLGRGAMGVVYRAIETGIDRSVALKILHAARDSQAVSESRRRGLREARAISRIRHRNVVPLYDFGEIDGHFFLVLEYASGGSLEKRLREPLPPQTAAQLVATIAGAVAYVHTRGLFHLDLKPSNILLDGNADGSWDEVTPMVSDFGLAISDGGRDVSETSLAGPRGTPSYMAPEQADGTRGQAEAAADIYGLGAILYHLLTGRPPFQAASALETLDQVRGQEPVPPRRLIPKIPRDLETVVLKCLEKSPTRRYGSANALEDDLKRFLDGCPIRARPVSPIEHVRRWCCRHPAVASLAAVLLLTVVGSFLGLTTVLRRSESQRLQSEANHEVASRSLDELVGIFADDMLKQDINPYNQYNRVRVIESARLQEIQLSQRYPSNIGNLKRLARLDSFLASIRIRDARQDEAISFMEECINCFESCISLDPDNVELHSRQLEKVIWILANLTDSKNDHLYERWNARAFAMLRRLESHKKLHVVELLYLSCEQRHHADSLMLRSESEWARTELEATLDQFRSTPLAETVAPEFVLSEALTLAALGRWSGELKPFQSSFNALPSIEGSSPLERGLAELTARLIGWLPSIAASPWLIPDNLSTKTWTNRVAHSIESSCEKFALDRNRVPVIAWMMRHHCFSTLGWLRRVRNLDAANRISDQVVALAEHLIRTHPLQPAPYMLLSEACVQKAKNAYAEDDRCGSERWERRAVDAAIRATMLEPENDLARDLVKNRRARLDKLTSR
jgi:eukaryotic-like serine/threonine-protein kinase